MFVFEREKPSKVNKYTLKSFEMMAFLEGIEGCGKLLRRIFLQWQKLEVFWSW